YAESYVDRTGGPSGSAAWVAGVGSRCWQALWRPTVFQGGSLPIGINIEAREELGLPMRLDLQTSPHNGTFLPPSPTLNKSSVSLVPPGAGGEATGWESASRPTLHRAVDLVTGVPL